MNMKAFIKAEMNKIGDISNDYEMNIEARGEIDQLIMLLRNIITDLSERSNVPTEKIVEAAIAKDEELFQKNLADVFEAYFKERRKWKGEKYEVINSSK